MAKFQRRNLYVNTVYLRSYRDHVGLFEIVGRSLIMQSNRIVVWKKKKSIRFGFLKSIIEEKFSMDAINFAFY